MEERLARSRGLEQPAPPSRVPTLQHCWVTAQGQRVPALLLEWRAYDGTWRGRVVRPVIEDGAWVVVEDWVDAGLLTPAGNDPD